MVRLSLVPAARSRVRKYVQDLFFSWSDLWLKGTLTILPWSKRNGSEGFKQEIFSSNFWSKVRNVGQPILSEELKKKKKIGNFSQATGKERKRRGEEIILHLIVTAYSCSSSRLHKAGRISEAQVQILGLKKY